MFERVKSAGCFRSNGFSGVSVVKAGNVLFDFKSGVLISTDLGRIFIQFEAFKERIDFSALNPKPPKYARGVKTNRLT